MWEQTGTQLDESEQEMVRRCNAGGLGAVQALCEDGRWRTSLSLAVSPPFQVIVRLVPMISPLNMAVLRMVQLFFQFPTRVEIA